MQTELKSDYNIKILMKKDGFIIRSDQYFFE